MVLLGDEAQWKLTFFHLEVVLILIQDRSTICAEHTTSSKNHFGCTRWNSQVTLVKWNLVLVSLETLLVSVHYRCTVCAKGTIGLEIVVDAPDGTTR
jgi:hypothetical protein